MPVEKPEIAHREVRIWARVQPDAAWDPGEWKPSWDGWEEGDASESDGCWSADDLEPSADRVDAKQAFREQDRWFRHRESQENNRLGMPRLIPPIDSSEP